MTLALGLVAAGLTILSFVSQFVKIMKTRDTKGLSTPMWILSTIAFVLWVVYGFVLDQWPIIIPNIICCVLAAIILVLRLKSGGQDDEKDKDAIEPSQPPETGWPVEMSTSTK